MMKVIFANLAKLELEDATLFYELEYPGLGKRFKQEVQNSIKRIIEYPKAWLRERGDVHRCLLHKFPHKILYSIEDDHILIIAIAHLHRNPDYWVEREET